MQKKWWVVINVLFLIVIVLVLFIFAYRFASPGEIVREEECIDVNNVASFVYDTCFDAYTKNIFISVKRGFDSYNIKKLKISFFDFSEKSYDLTDVPNTDDSKYYQVSAEKNPQNIDVFLDVVKDFSSPICKGPRKLFVKYCPSGISQEGVNSTISPLNSEGIESFIEIGAASSEDSDILSINLVEKERIWASQCESHWDCSPWESCVGGIERRKCNDSKNCFVPTDVPDTARYCDGTCVEKWECKWSKCKNGFTTPECEDKNRCGTSYDIPTKLSCDTKGDCIPDITCSEWSECSMNYSFVDLTKGVQNLGGFRSRICSDSNACSEAVFETGECSVGVDIYTKRIKKCGIDYIGVYNKLNNELISRIDIGDANNPHLNIDLSGGIGEYCDYCFDGVQNGDETGIDCGGSCESCEDKYVPVNYKKVNFLDRIANWFVDFFS